MGDRSGREVAVLTHTSPPAATEAGVRPRYVPGPQWSTGVKEMGTFLSHPPPSPHHLSRPRLKRNWGDKNGYLGAVRDPHAWDAAVSASEGDPSHWCP